MKPTKENRLEKLLRSRKNWTTAKRCCQLMQFSTNEIGRRAVREMAEHSEGVVISGQQGYKHVIWASLEDLHHATAKLRSQAKKMNKRANQIERQWERE